ncbi:MAG TPA: YciI-like protein [Gemmatimonadales bacterium]|nr:YciI-like protein [Gemmatimonadales bacterium]
MHYLLFYDVVDDYITRRVPVRSAHLDYAQPFVERGELILAGALAEPADAAILLFQATSPALVEAFAQADPYVLGGLVRRWWVREWTTVLGPLAAVPIQSGSR